MIHACVPIWWVPLTFVVTLVVSVFVMALATVSGQDDHDRDTDDWCLKRHQPL